ncbi:MAG: PocR ligand-binding domain-containing protein [Myxococcales bacterium]|nr:PocR ligand-binding domain-containing protein [Myxococcales bacterium]
MNRKPSHPSGSHHRLPVLGGQSDDIHGELSGGFDQGFSPSTHDLKLDSDMLLDEETVYTRPASSSVLDRRPSLSELLDVDMFRDICTSFVELYQVGIKIFDVDGTKLVDIRTGNGDWCGYIFNNSTGRTKCTGVVSRIKQFQYPELEEGLLVEESCFSGLRYVIMPVTYSGDVIGRVVYGPFLPASVERPGDEVYDFGDGFDPHRLWRYGDKIRRATDEMNIKILKNFKGVIDTVTFIAIKDLMARQLHEESITASYKELSDANHRLRSSLEKLQQVDRMKSSFLAMVSHELKTPLTSVIGYSEMLMEGVAGDLNSDQLRYLGTIKGKGETLLDLIGSLLDLSRMEAGGLELDITTVDIPRLVEDAVSSVVPQAQKKRILLRREIVGNLPTLRGDTDKLAQVLVNLLGNAVKFTAERGRVEVHADTWRGPRRGEVDPTQRFGAPEEDFIRMQVIDDGIGIPPDQVNRIFDSFYQVDSTITREFGGTGLGLAITKKLVEAHRGEIGVESQPGQGTRFTVLLPL